MEQWFKIAEQIIRLESPVPLNHRPFLDFSIPKQKKASGGSKLSIQNTEGTFVQPDFVWNISTEGALKEEGRKPLVKSREMTVFERDGGYKIEFPKGMAIQSLVLDSCADRVQLYLDKQKASLFCPAIVEGQMIYALEIGFLCGIQRKGLLAVHSSSILYRGRAYLFSASAGTGKTTHTNLWKQYYQAEILDGDITACAQTRNGMAAFGLPWCGTSGEYQNMSCPLGGVIFLHRGAENKIHRLGQTDAIMNLIARTFNPGWTEALMDYNLEAARVIAEAVPCYQLFCRPERQAVQTVYQALFTDKAGS